MKRYLALTQRLVLLAAPVLATTVFGVSPSRAATLSFADATLDITNLKTKFSTTESQNQGTTLALANGGTVNVQNSGAVANIIPKPLEIYTAATSIATGENRDYLGTADTTAKVIGNFDVDPGNLFSFNFTSTLDLETAIDHPRTENASASGQLSFFLLDTSNIPKQNLSGFLSDLLSNPSRSILQNALDFFSLTGNINTLGNNNLITTNKSGNVTLFDEDKEFSFGGTQEFATDIVEGSLRRYFANKTNLTLVAFRSTQVRVAAPEPSNSLALILLLGLVAVANHKTERKTEKVRE
jgi:hypothetical protein